MGQQLEVAGSVGQQIEEGAASGTGWQGAATHGGHHKDGWPLHRSEGAGAPGTWRSVLDGSRAARHLTQQCRTGLLHGSSLAFVC